MDTSGVTLFSVLDYIVHIYIKKGLNNKLDNDYPHCTIKVPSV